jgi:hypothetical protein
MKITSIDRLYQDNDALLGYLEHHGEASLKSVVETLFPKTLLLAAASYFEDQIKQSLKDFFGEQSHDIVVQFLQNKAIERQYHTYFQWDKNNANNFFGLFGKEFKAFMTAEVNHDQAFKESIPAFLELGRLRNQLVHENFATFPLDKTAQEIYELYQQAALFVETFPHKLRTFVEGSADTSPQ